jgi:CRP-like cAMP-binding protein
MEQLLGFLESVHPIGESLKTGLYKVVKSCKLKKHRLLLKEGQICRNIYFIHTGLLRCYYLLEETEVCTWFMRERDICVSVSSFYDQIAGYEYIQALEDCELYYISHSELEEIYRSHAQFNYTGRVLTIKYLKDWTRQMRILRMQKAEERYLQFRELEPELVQRVPQKYLAPFLGMQPETLSRIRKKLAGGGGR